MKAVLYYRGFTDISRKYPRFDRRSCSSCAVHAELTGIPHFYHSRLVKTLNNEKIDLIS